MPKKATVTIQERFAAHYDSALGKFNPSVLDSLVEKIEVFRNNVEILENLFSDKVRNVWVSRNGQIAEAIDEHQKLLTKVLVKGKGAGNSVSMWQNVKTLQAITENDAAVEKLQGWIDAIKDVGTDKNAQISRKGRVSKYPNAVTVKFIETDAINTVLDAEYNAVRLYDSVGTLFGYMVTPKKRATK